MGQRWLDMFSVMAVTAMCLAILMTVGSLINGQILNGISLLKPINSGMVQR